ncbi:MULTISPECIES: twin-arginine translocase TatA/TatE family subunit [Halarchaeum]|uniref:Sec-independent protein translocase protein TatA n=1 Tax=Halarchaeum grantii TaxID=1193105 RepID=A0A830EYB0_9EURY|nr:twin-arginine translocase TatA/TatE family subunit [Halarchaeum grantii]
MLTSTPAFLGGMPGGMELALILLIAVLLFGANKIPKLARSTGQAMGEFKRGREEIEEELQEVRDGGADDSEESEVVTETESTDTSKSAN